MPALVQLTDDENQVLNDKYQERMEYARSREMHYSVPNVIDIYVAKMG